MSSLISQYRPEIEALCRRYGVRRLDAFGSAVREDFDPAASDVDFVVDFANFTVLDAADRYLGLLVDLEDLLGRSVDLVSVNGIRNPYFKQILDQTRVPIYHVA